MKQNKRWCIDLVLLVTFSIVNGSVLNAQTVQLKPNPVVSEFAVQQGTSLSVSAEVVTSGFAQGTYHIRINFKRQDDVVFTLYNQQWPLYSGQNFTPVNFTLDANVLFSTSYTQGTVYAEVQEVVPNSIAYKSATISAKQVSGDTPGDGGGDDGGSGTGPCTYRPIAPSNLAAKALPDNTVLLTWSDNSNNETAFEFRRNRLGGGHDFTFDAPPNATEVIDYRGLLSDTAYIYKIRSEIGDCESAYGEHAIVTLGCPSSVPIYSTFYLDVNVFAEKIQAAESINTRNVSLKSGNTTVTAGNYIKLEPPTTIKSGVNFVAKIEPCTVASSASSSSLETMEAFQAEEREIFVYPNPTEGQLSVYFKTPLSEGARILLFDKFGNQVYSKKIEAGFTEVHVDLPPVPRDTYYLNVIVGGKIMRERVVIK